MRDKDISKTMGTDMIMGIEKPTYICPECGDDMLSEKNGNRIGLFCKNRECGYSITGTYI